MSETDIVARLREHTPDATGKSYVWGRTMKDAGDAIERLRSDLSRMREALEGLADNVEACARDSFAQSHETFESDFEAEDPDGFGAWKNARAALSPSSGENR